MQVPRFVARVPLFILLVASAPGATPPTPTHGCEPTLEVRQALRHIPLHGKIGQAMDEHRARALLELRKLLERYPDSLFVHQRYLELSRLYPRTGHEDVIEQYRRLAETRSDDPRYHYYYGLALFSRDTHESIARMEKALALAPDFPWPHLELGRIHSYPAFLDPKKARDNLESFLSRCPGVFEAYVQYSRLELPQESLQKASARLREALGQGEDPEKLRYFSVLWTMEFNAIPQWDHERVREQVRRDVDALKKIDVDQHGRVLFALAQAYRMLGDEAGQKSVASKSQALQRGSRVARMKEFMNVENQWREDHPRPKSEAPWSDHQDYYRAQWEAAVEGTRQWPEDFSPWYSRLSAVHLLDEVSEAEVRTTSAKILELAAQGTAASNVYLTVANVWLKHGVLVERVPEVLDKAWQRFRGRRIDLLPKEQYAERLRQQEDMLKWRDWEVRVALHAELGEASHAGEVIAEMEGFLGKQPADVSDPRLGRLHATRESNLWAAKAQLAEAENNPSDALALYQQALQHRPKNDGAPPSPTTLALTETTRRLWVKQGGSEQEFKAWLDGSDRTSIPNRDSERLNWTKLDQPLPQFELTDLSGRTWRLDSFKGKVTLIAIWGHLVAESRAAGARAV